MIILNLIAYTLLPVLGVMLLGWQFVYIVTIYFWETALIGLFVTVKLFHYKGPKIKDIKDPNYKTIALVTSPWGFAFYFFFALAILSVLFFGAFLRQDPVPLKEIFPVLVYLFIKNVYEYLRYFAAPAAYQGLKKEEMITGSLKDSGILMLGVLLGGVVLTVSKDAAVIAMIVMMSTVFMFSFLGGIFGFNETIIDLGWSKKIVEFLTGEKDDG